VGTPDGAAAIRGSRVLREGVRGMDTKMHQWLGRCPLDGNCHNDLDEVVELNARLQYPDPGTKELAIRDVDEPKFHAPSRHFDVANTAWWALRVVDWGLNPRNDGYAGRADAMNRAYQSMRMHARELEG
jgi:hypothetical protein